MSDLLTDEAVAATTEPTLEAMDEAAESGWWKSEKIGGHGHARRIIAAFIVHHEGERPCERCDDGRLSARSRNEVVGPECPDCGGTGKTRTDKLVKLSEILHFIRRQNRNEWMAEQIEREFGVKP